HQGKNALHQFIAALVMKLPQVHTAYVSFFIGIAPWAPQRTLPRDFNGERWPPASQDAFPGLNDFAGPHKFFPAVNLISSPALAIEVNETLASGLPKGEKRVATVRKETNKALHRSNRAHWREKWWHCQQDGNALKT